MKKTKLRALLSMGLAAALMVGLVAVTALADDGVPTVTYDHSVKQFQFTNVAAYSDEHGHQYPDLFRDLKNLMPGDAVSQAIKVKVSGTGRGSVNMYLKVESEGDGISADEKLDYAELLDAEGVTLTVKQGETETVLPQTEFYLLYKLLSAPGHIFTRQQLMDEIWGMETETEARTVDVHINRLRERFKDNADFSIVTVRGLGYKSVKN